MKRTLVALCLLVLALTGWYLVKGRAPSKEDVGSKADLALEGVRYAETEGGRVKWELEARKVEYWASEEVTRAQDLRVVFFLEDGRKVTAVAREGAVRQGEKGFIELKGDVELKTADGWSLRTEVLRYEASEEVVRTSTPVRIKGPGLTLKGVGLEVKLDSQHLLIPEEVEALLKEG